MILTKGKLADQVMRYIARYDRPREERLDERDVLMRIDQETNYLAKQNMLENMESQGLSVDPQFLTTFKNIEVKHDSDYNLDYIDLPARYVALSSNRGVDLICPMQSRQHPFIPLDKGHIGLYENNLAGPIQGRTGFWIESGKAYFNKDVKGVWNKLLVRLVLADASSITDDAPYPIPAELEAQIVEKVAVFFLKNPTLPDDKNDLINKPKEQ